MRASGALLSHASLPLKPLPKYFPSFTDEKGHEVKQNARVPVSVYVMFIPYTYRHTTRRRQDMWLTCINSHSLLFSFFLYKWRWLLSDSVQGDAGKGCYKLRPKTFQSLKSAAVNNRWRHIPSGQKQLETALQSKGPPFPRGMKYWKPSGSKRFPYSCCSAVKTPLWDSCFPSSTWPPPPRALLFSSYCHLRETKSNWVSLPRIFD